MKLTEVRSTLYSVLTGAEALSNKINGVWDDPPQSVTAPYITIGEDHIVPGRNLDERELRIHIRVHIWSTYQGSAEAYQILNLVLAALPVSFQFDDFELLVQEGWRHGVISLRTYAERE